MKTKTLMMLAAVTLLLTVVVLLMVRRPVEAPALPSRGADAQPLLPGARAEMARISIVTLKRGANETVIEKRGSEWVLPAKDNYPADDNRVRTFVGDVLQSTIAEMKTAKPDLYERIGVADIDAPGATGALVTLGDEAGKPIGSVIIGNASQAPAAGSAAGDSDPRFFVRRSGEAQSYLARGNLNVVADPITWAKRSVLDIDASKVQSVIITHRSEGQPDQTLTISRAAPTVQQFALENIPAGREAKDAFSAGRAAQALSAVQMDDVAAARIDMTRPETTAEYHLFDGSVITARMLTHDAKKWWSFEASYEERPPPEMPAVDPANTDPAAAEAARAQADKDRFTERNTAEATVADLNKKLSGWIFVLPDYKAQSINMTMEDLLKPLASPATQPPGGTPTMPTLPE